MRRIQDVRGGAVVLFQFHDLRVLEILFEFQDVADVRAAPLVDALVVVPHHADVVALFAGVVFRLRQHFDELVLDLVGVLVLVDHDVLESPLILEENAFVFLKKFHGLQQQVVEVHGVVLLQFFFIPAVDLLHHPVLNVVPIHLGILLR